ncbi:unnamed protein product [Calypogeia fissa]
MVSRGVWNLPFLAVLAVLLLVTVATTSVSSLPSLSLPPLVPAFVWSNHRKLDSNLPSAISYQTLSSEDFAEKVNSLVLGQQRQQSEDDDGVGFGQQEESSDLDVVVVFVGTKLRSWDISRGSGTTEESSSNILQVLTRVVTSSNSSLSLPYVALPRDGASVADALVKKIVQEEESESKLGEVITTESCKKEEIPQAKRLSLSGLQEYLPTRMNSRGVGKTDLVVVCGRSVLESSRGGSISLSEGETLGEVLWGLDEWSTRYVALYTTDLSGEKDLPVRPRGRQLVSGDGEDEYCDSVCQTKATILEGLMVGLTLLIILISGLCCMSGITTPNRFEQSKEGQ